MSENKEELKCVWCMGTPCEGKVSEVSFFNNQITIPVCEKHVEEHKHIMILHKNNYDVEEILQESPDYRKGEVLVLKLSGLDDSDVDL